jgi:acetyltransferase-like isoleucine patch superfamily enzyme
MGIYKRLRGFNSENGALMTIIRTKEIFAESLRSAAYSKIFASDNVSIGRKSKIRGVKFISLGANFRAGDDFWIEAISAYGGQTHKPQIAIGNNVIFMNRVHIAAVNYIKIANDVLMGSNVLITDHFHGKPGFDEPQAKDKHPALRDLNSRGGVTIGERVWIGDGVCIMPGVSIGVGAIIGANAVVTKSVESGAVVAGNPARVISR